MNYNFTKLGGSFLKHVQNKLSCPPFGPSTSLQYLSCGSGSLLNKNKQPIVLRGSSFQLKAAISAPILVEGEEQYVVDRIVKQLKK